MQVSDPSVGLQEERTGAWSSFSITVSAEVQTEGIRWVRDYGRRNHSSDSLYSPLDNDVSVGPTRRFHCDGFFRLTCYVFRTDESFQQIRNEHPYGIASTRDMCFSPVSNPERVNPLETTVLWFPETQTIVSRFRSWVLADSRVISSLWVFVFSSLSKNMLISIETLQLAVQMRNLITENALAEIRSLVCRNDRRTSSISVECKPPACREYGPHTIWRGVDILLWPWCDLYLDVWPWSY